MLLFDMSLDIERKQYRNNTARQIYSLTMVAIGDGMKIIKIDSRKRSSGLKVNTTIWDLIAP